MNALVTFEALFSLSLCDV